MDFRQFENEKKKIIENLKSFTDKGIALVSYGKGEFAEQTKELLKPWGVEISDTFVDPEYKRSNLDFTLEDCKKKYADFVILSCVSHMPSEKKEEFEREIQVKGVFSLGQNYPVGEPFMTMEYLHDHKKQLRMVYNWLEDEVSREAFEAFIKAKLSGNTEYLKNAAQKSGREYFHELFGEFHDEIIVDGGAFTGDTYREALDAKMPYVKYYAFEPDTINYKKLVENTLKDKRVIPLNKGLYDTEKTLTLIEKGNVSSQLLENGGGGAKVQVTCIDKIAGDATFIKLDVEGSELSVLNGAEKTILCNKPKLAVCAYHRLEDIIEIPSKIKSINEKYKIYFRQHLGNMTRDLLVYAFVDENSNL